jgi:putative transcriptional regulator
MSKNEKDKLTTAVLENRGIGNRRLHCRLKEIMAAKGITGKRLHQIAHVGREAICQLGNNNFKAVSAKVIVRICGALQIDIADLFEILPEDIWLPIRLTKEVTFHFGSRVFADMQPRPDMREVIRIRRPHIGLSDFRAFMQIQAHLSRIAPDVRVRFEEHVTNPAPGTGADHQATVKRIFERGNHVFLGSPIALGLVEEVVCHAYGVSPYDPAVREAFPYAFAWDAWRDVRSSLGWQGHGKQCGIAALPSGKIVAPYARVEHGEGTDGGLIVVYRVFNPPSLREVGNDDERIIICLLGFGGMGTEACAQIAIDSERAAGLYPAERQLARMRAAACSYFLEEAPLLTRADLVAEPKLRPQPRLRAVGGRRKN